MTAPARARQLTTPKGPNVAVVLAAGSPAAEPAVGSGAGVSIPDRGREG